MMAAFLNFLNNLIKSRLFKWVAIKVGAKLSGPVGWLVGFAYDYLWKYVERYSMLLYKKIKLKVKSVKRSKAKKEIKESKDAKELKSSVDDFLG